eukprot:scaffold63917_cov52-Phaeocystis_antarctica.AAC.3
MPRSCEMPRLKQRDASEMIEDDMLCAAFRPSSGCATGKASSGRIAARASASTRRDALPPLPPPATTACARASAVGPAAGPGNAAPTASASHRSGRPCWSRSPMRPPCRRP